MASCSPATTSGLGVDDNRIASRPCRTAGIAGAASSTPGRGTWRASPAATRVCWYATTRAGTQTSPSTRPTRLSWPSCARSCARRPRSWASGSQRANPATQPGLDDRAAEHRPPAGAGRLRKKAGAQRGAADGGVNRGQAAHRARPRDGCDAGTTERLNAGREGARKAALQEAALREAKGRRALNAGTQPSARTAGGLLTERGAEMAAARGGPSANSFRRSPSCAPPRARRPRGWGNGARRRTAPE